MIICINDYYYKPRGLFRTKKYINKYKPKQLFLGMELELNNIHDNAIQNLFINSLDIEKYGNCDVCRPTRNWDGDVIHSIYITPRVNDITGKEDKVIFIDIEDAE